MSNSLTDEAEQNLQELRVAALRFILRKQGHEISRASARLQLVRCGNLAEASQVWMRRSKFSFIDQILWRLRRSS